MSLKQLFIKTNVGTVPTYFHLELDKEELIDRALESIDKVLKDQHINSRFPFPLYIICPFRSHFRELNIVHNENELPGHFKKKPQKLKNKEMGLLSKTEISSERIKNQNINEKMNLIKDIAEGHRLLSELTRESHFYQKALLLLKEKKQKEAEKNG